METFSYWSYSDDCTYWSNTVALHLQSEPRFHKPVECFSCSQKNVFFFSSSITARPYLILFKQWRLLWWISNVRELENYYLDSAVGFFLFFFFVGWPIIPRFLQGALALIFHLHKLSPSLLISLVMSETDLLLAKFVHLTLYKERGAKDNLYCMSPQSLTALYWYGYYF